MTDINKELFKRYKPENKMKIVENLSTNDLLRIKPETLVRMIKEAGRKIREGCRDKEILLGNDTCGNNWDSTMPKVGLYKNKLMIELYIQLDSTDTSIFVPWEKFTQQGEYVGHVTKMNRYGDQDNHYFRYSEFHKASCIKSILKKYIIDKYKISNKISSEKDKSASIYDVVNHVHHETVRHCDYCGAPMSRSDVNDYGSLCERCYMKEYYPEE